MAPIHVEVKLLNGKTPLLFAWWDKVEQAVKACLVTCQCQGLQLSDSKSCDGSRTLTEQALRAQRIIAALHHSEVISIIDEGLAPKVASTVDPLVGEDVRNVPNQSRKTRRGANLAELTSENDFGKVSSDAESREQEESVDPPKDAPTLPEVPPFDPPGSSVSPAHPNKPPRGTDDESSHSANVDVPPSVSTLPATAVSPQDQGQYKVQGVLTCPDGGDTAGPVVGEKGGKNVETSNMAADDQGASNSFDGTELPEMPNSETSVSSGGVGACGSALTGAASQGKEPKIEEKECRRERILCELCGKFVSQEGMKKHTKNCHSEGKRVKSFQCERCPATFYLAHNLKRHTKTHNGVRYKCRFCDKSYTQDWWRKVHENIHFPKDSPIFPRKKQYPRVRQSQNYDTTVECQICGKTVKKHMLRTHISSHSSKLYTCKICGQTMKYPSRYTHLRLHTHTKDQHCPHCPMSFHFKVALKMHIRTHTKERPIKCRYCDMTFSHYGTRQNHERRHTGRKPYRCDLCEKSWRDRPTYTQHMKTNHPGRPMMFLRKQHQPAETPTQVPPLKTSLDILCQAIAAAE